MIDDDIKSTLKAIAMLTRTALEFIEQAESDSREICGLWDPMPSLLKSIKNEAKALDIEALH